jgi:DNA-binding transcriptional MerR regulator
VTSAGHDALVTDDQLYSITSAAASFGVPVSTLRYYDDIGLVPATGRRSGVRHYDRAALMQLAYVQLWRLDGLLGIEDTSAILHVRGREKRNELLERCRTELSDRITRLQEAHDLLTHAMKCHSEDQSTCPIIRAYLDERVDTALGVSDDQLGSARTELARLAASLLEGDDEEAVMRLHGLLPPRA